MLAYLYIHVYYLSGICNERCVLGNKQDFTSFIDINCVRNYNVICCQMFVLHYSHRGLYQGKT